jgi:hypothetical protein
MAPYISPGAQSAGMMRFNTNSSQIEVYDGIAWKQMDMAYTSIDLSPEAQDLLQWARTQRQLDLNRKTLIENNPALRKAYEAIQRAEDNFDLLATIAGEEEPGIVAGYNFNTP